MPPPRDGEIAIKEQFDYAVESKDIEALKLFINRYPNHDLAQKALEEIKKLTTNND